MSNGLTGVRADQRTSYKKLEQLAEYVRSALKFNPDEAIDLLRLFENLDDVSIKLRNGTLIPLRSHVVALENSEGYTRYDRPRNVLEILASELTYERLQQGHPRAGYFLAHELGHCILHTDQLVRLAEMPPNQQQAFHRGGLLGHQPCEDTEWQANAFGSALLMPARGIAALEKSYGQVNAAMIANQFSVSKEAAGYRLDCYLKRGKELLR